MKHLPYLDGWRAIAILLVLGGHFFDLPAQRLGVEVFFVLSGLFMSQLLFEDRTPLGTFYKRRIARIFPGFFLFLGAIALVAAVVLPEFPTAQFAFNALFFQQYMPGGFASVASLPLGRLWSLNVEEHSYIFLSLVALMFAGQRQARYVVSLAAVGCVVMYAVYAQTGAQGLFRTECAAFPLLASAALRMWLNGTKQARPLLIASTVGLLVCIAVSRKIGGSIAIDYIVKTFCLAAMVNTLHAAPARVHQALSASWLRWFGICSFSLYLWQQPLYHWVSDGLMNRYLAFGAAVAVGAMSFYFFEKPMRERIRNLKSPETIHDPTAAS
jgi:peptidoglycan/LPS O-acetylase OafA/YrhL